MNKAELLKVVSRIQRIRKQRERGVACKNKSKTSQKDSLKLNEGEKKLISAVKELTEIKKTFGSSLGLSKTTKAQHTKFGPKKISFAEMMKRGARERKSEAKAAAKKRNAARKVRDTIEKNIIFKKGRKATELQQNKTQRTEKRKAKRKAAKDTIATTHKKQISSLDAKHKNMVRIINKNLNPQKKKFFKFRITEILVPHQLREYIELVYSTVI
tara:strand:+ start:145 stop:786 length:642 start_codon:yes stop_codon:yes gene_type:complete